MIREAIVTNIQRYSINDGPGIRTTVFLKGCPLHCAWCHNPECIHAQPDIYWKQSLCRQCGRCFDVCDQGAIQPPIALDESSDGHHYYKIDTSRCNRCMACVDACMYGALVKVGEARTVEEVLEEVERDLPFYLNSGGGMTVTGGEPTAFPEFTLELLRTAKERGIHTCLDTSGFCAWEVLDTMRPYVDIFLYDVKCLSGKQHILRTGVNNSPILDNLRRLAGVGADIIVRLPIIPGFNDTVEQMKEVADFLVQLAPSLVQVDVLPFHNWCQDKYRWLGMDWEYGESQSMTAGDVDALFEVLELRGLNATIGG
jgi:pyruvate formate lyase activating enzyme